MEDITRCMIVPLVTHLMNANERWTQNEGQRFKIQAQELSYSRSAAGLNRIDGKSIGSVHGKFDMSIKDEGINCENVEVAKKASLGGLVVSERMRQDEMTKMIYKSEVDAGWERVIPNKMIRQC